MDEQVIFCIRPPIDTPNEVTVLLEDYFNIRHPDRCEWTLSGLAFHFGMSLDEFHAFSRGKDERARLVRQAMTLIASVVEADMRSRGKGYDLSLKQMGYRDDIQAASSGVRSEMPRILVRDGIEVKELEYNVGKEVSDE